MPRPSQLIEIYRSVRPLESQVEQKLTDAVKAENPQAKIYFYKPPHKVTLLGAGCLGKFIENIQADVRDVDLNDLEEYLDLHLPVSSTEDLVVPALPFGRHVTGKHHLFTLGADNQSLQSERQTAKTLIEEFFGVDAMDTTDLWTDRDYSSEHWLAKAKDAVSATALHAVLEQGPDFLPSTLFCELVEFEDQAFMPSQSRKIPAFN